MLTPEPGGPPPAADEVDGTQRSSEERPEGRENERWMSLGAEDICGRVVHISMRPTRSVVETPSVRLMYLKRPAALAAAYASLPSGSRHGSSPCRM